MGVFLVIFTITVTKKSHYLLFPMMQKDVVPYLVGCVVVFLCANIHKCPIFFIQAKLFQPLLCRWFGKVFILFFVLVQNAGEDLGVLEGAKPSKDWGGIQQEETILLGQDPFRVEPVLRNGVPGSCRRAALYCLLFVAWTLIQFYKSTCVFRSYLIYPVPVLI